MNESLTGQKHKFIQNLKFIIQFQRVSVTIGFYEETNLIFLNNYKNISVDVLFKKSFSSHFNFS